jgi:hypothetical protein
MAAELLDTPRPPNPYDDAVCVSGGYDPDDWFKYTDPDGPGGRPTSRQLRRRAEVKTRCWRCPVRDLCWEDYQDEPFGIIAGTEPAERGFAGSPSNRRRYPGNTTGPAVAGPEAER